VPGLILLKKNFGPTRHWQGGNRQDGKLSLLKAGLHPPGYLAISNDGQSSPLRLQNICQERRKSIGSVSPPPLDYAAVAPADASLSLCASRARVEREHLVASMMLDQL
jgi:hypothetical protein